MKTISFLFILIKCNETSFEKELKEMNKNYGQTVGRIKKASTIETKVAQNALKRIQKGDDMCKNP